MPSRRSSRSHQTSYNYGYTGNPADQQTQWLTIYVAVFAPYAGNYYHWCIGVYDTSTRGWHIYDATRTRAGGPFQRSYRSSDPRNSTRCVEPLVHLGSVNRAYWNEVFDAFDSVRISNHPQWDCQSYVSEIIAALVDSGLVDLQKAADVERELAGYGGKMPFDFGEVQQAQAHERGALSAEFIENSDDSD